MTGRALHDDPTTDPRGEIAAITTPTVVLYPWDQPAAFAAEVERFLDQAACGPCPGPGE